jgi:hypothetical protein
MSRTFIDKFDPTLADEDDSPFPLYTMGQVKQILQKIFPAKRILGIQVKVGGSIISWFNWLIYRLVTVCLSALETVKFQDLLTEQNVASFFNPKYYVENYIKIPESLSNCEDLYFACLLSGIEEDDKRDEKNPTLLRDIPLTENGYFLMDFLLKNGYLFMGNSKARISHTQSFLLYSGLKRFFKLYDM